MTDEETFALIRDRLFTAVIGDVMDAAGFTQQFLPPEIRALQPDAVLVGRAMPVLRPTFRRRAATARARSSGSCSAPSTT